MFSAMKYAQGVLRLIDQRRLPGEEIWLDCRDLEAVAVAIEEMAVRGAPAIGCAAAYALAVDARRPDVAPVWGGYRERFVAGIERLARTRPTAVNLFYALDRMRALAATLEDTVPRDQVVARIEALAQQLHDEDVATCRAIGRNGAALAAGRRLRILTHCNTGSLATAGFGTALGVIRTLAEQGQVELVYVDETRPWLQGARLTAFELGAEAIPYKVISDSAAAYLMQQGKVDWAIVGADRIAANGDTANKIGTYGLAVQCHHHGVPFYVAAPLATFDFKIPNGAAIPVEERPAEELRSMGGRQLTPLNAEIWNPSFDVTPAELITGIITESTVLQAPYTEAISVLRFGTTGV